MLQQGSKYRIGESSICLLGLNYIGHDASASLVVDGEVVFSAPEERFDREKKSRAFPRGSMDACLSYAGLSVERLDGIAYYMDPEEMFRERVIHHFGRYYPKTVPIFEPTLDAALAERKVEQEVRELLSFDGPFYHVRHHDAHFASCFYTSPFEEAAILSVDGIGEINTAVVGYGKGNRLFRIKEVNYPHSLGLAYAGITYYLGFSWLGHGGKAMALASFGDPDRYISEFRKLINVNGNGEFELDLDYFAFPFVRDKWVSDKFIETFGPRREADEEPTQQHMDVAAGLQRRTEEVMLGLASYAREKTGYDRLCLAGGVALNSVANGKLIQSGLFDEIFMIPTCGDDGTSIGAALYVYHQLMERKQRRQFPGPYLGPEYSPTDIVNVIQANDQAISYERRDDVFQRAAHAIADGEIVGWFQDRMEIGPRALGHRSILADPRRPEMKDVLNRRVKHRESFRPFAPSVLAEHQGDWFECDYPSDFMLFVYGIRHEKRGEIPSVVHCDGTGRLQSVRKELSAGFYRLIQEFHKITGVPIVLNTSFNVQGQPIVCSPEDAIQCFMSTEIDRLFIGDFEVRKV